MRFLPLCDSPLLRFPQRTGCLSFDFADSGRATWYRRLRRDLAVKHLAEAQQIAERGPMPLFLADIHVTRARLTGSVEGEMGSWKVDAKVELTQAPTRIRTLGYGRRCEELSDALDCGSLLPP